MREKILLLTNSKTGAARELRFPGSRDKRKSFFLFSTIKSGSSLLNVLMKDYFRKSGISIIDIPQTLFKIGEPVHHVLLQSSQDFFETSGYGFAGWRNFWKGLSGLNLEDFNNIYLVRDPRDRLVSLYFSLAYSHVIPKAGQAKSTLLRNRDNALEYSDINEWIMNSPDMINVVKNSILGYQNNLPYRSTRVYRYEDVIFKKEQWMMDMLHFIGIEIERKKLVKIVNKHDIIPSHEKLHQHIRQVKPGNYKKHIRKDVLDTLNREFEDILSLYGYDIDDTHNYESSLIFALEGSTDHPFNKSV